MSKYPPVEFKTTTVPVDIITYYFTGIVLLLCEIVVP